jgi:hypothetical protein
VVHRNALLDNADNVIDGATTREAAMAAFAARQVTSRSCRPKETSTEDGNRSLPAYAVTACRLISRQAALKGSEDHDERGRHVVRVRDWPV